MTFDLERYQYQSRQLDLSGLDWDAVACTPLSPEAVRALIYMMDIEGSPCSWARGSSTSSPRST